MSTSSEIIGIDGSVSAGELLSHGINPECPMSSKRISGRPIKIRFGDDLIKRSQSGAMQHIYGHYSGGDGLKALSADLLYLHEDNS